MGKDYYIKNNYIFLYCNQVLLYISKYDWISGIFIILANTIKIKYKVNVKF